MTYIINIIGEGAFTFYFVNFIMKYNFFNKFRKKNNDGIFLPKITIFKRFEKKKFLPYNFETGSQKIK